MEESQRMEIQAGMTGKKKKISFRLRGSDWAKWSKSSNFCFFAQNVSSGMGALRPKFLGG